MRLCSGSTNGVSELLRLPLRKPKPELCKFTFDRTCLGFMMLPSMALYMSMVCAPAMDCDSSVIT